MQHNFPTNGQIFAANMQTIASFYRSGAKVVTSFLTAKSFAMKTTILLLAVSLAAFSSCTTAYKTGQTPDDVYYSPARPQQNNDDEDNDEEYARIEKNDDRQYRSNDEYYDDRYLRMKVQNRSRWSELDDWYFNDYRYRRYYSYSNNYCCCNSSWIAHSWWNSYYNPYYNNYVIINPKTTFAYSRPRTFNLNTYTPGSVQTGNNSNPKYNTAWGSNNTGSNNNNYNGPRNSSSTNNSNSGNVLRNIFRGSGSSGSNNNSGSSGSSGSSNNNSSSGSSGSSSSGGSSKAPVRKF